MSVVAVVTVAVERSIQILAGPMETWGGGAFVDVQFAARSMIAGRTVAVIGIVVDMFTRRPVLATGMGVVHTVVLPSFTVQSNVTRLTDTGKAVVTIHTRTPVLTR